MQDIIRNIRAGISIGNTLDAFEKDIKISDAPEKTETSWGNPVITQELVDAYIAAGLNKSCIGGIYYLPAFLVTAVPLK